MNERTDELKREWEARSDQLGSTERAVLSKRFPGWLNHSIHRRHISFILDNCPGKLQSVLDVGCGYGRISSELAVRFPDARFRGVDLCTRFSAEYERTVGPCFNGPIQEFTTDERFDLILVVTTLMYLTSEERTEVLEQLWSLLAPGGRLICIEPASEMFQLWRRLTGKESASPTAGTVQHFLLHQLEGELAHLERSVVREKRSVTILPYVVSTAVHHGICLEKKELDPVSSAKDMKEAR